MLSGRVSHYLTCRPPCRERSWHDHPGCHKAPIICTPEELMLMFLVPAGPTHASRTSDVVDSTPDQART